jgi:hypothetical protein
MSIDKTVATAAEAVADIRDGASIAVGGFGLSGNPMILIAAILDSGAKDLSIVSNNCGVDDWGLGVLLKAHRIGRMTSSYAGEKVERAASATSKSAVSRRFVAMTETALAELLAVPLGQLDLVALMIDGVHFGEHLCVVALGIGIDGTKHPLGLVEGSTENTTVVTELLTDLRGRGLDTARPILVGIDGGKALRAGIVKVFDHPVIQRCQMHYADLRIMPMLMGNPLQGNDFAAGRSA